MKIFRGRRLPIGMTVLMGIALLPGGCWKGTGESRKTLTFWAMGAESEAVRLLIPTFEREHPGIRVSVETLPWKGAHQKLLTAFAGGSTPDLCQLGNTWISEFAAVGALTPLGQMVKASSIVEQSDYFPGIWDTNVIGGALYGVPWYVDTRLLFYRKDLLEKAGFDHPPRTRAEWARQMAAIKAMAGPGRYAVLLPLNEFEPLVSFGLQQSGSMLREGGRYGNFESPGFKRALHFYGSIFRNGWAPLLTDADISNLWAEFAKGYFTFFLSGPWNLSELKANMPANLRNAWASAPLPGPNGPGASIAGGSSLVIFGASHHKKAAWQLIEFLSEPKVQSRFYQLVGDLPPRRTAWENSSLAGDPNASAFRVQLERAKPTPKVPEWQHIATEIGLIGERLAHGELTANQAARELDQRADAILAKRRWILDKKSQPLGKSGPAGHGLHVPPKGLTFCRSLDAG
ncbi:MAG: sugar ABC transporter substrate-binding protein [Syntrophobacteraceae bacterium]|nr:sugar ABC transporter substrate-binding protein [Syntrophobacteraceae bacterium]